MAEKTPVGDMPRMVPDRDDIRVRQPSATIEPKSKPTPKAKSEPAPQRGPSGVMVTLLIVAGIAIGYLALQQYSLTQLLNSYEERLVLADDRIVALERAMTETDESVAMNGTAINAQFKAIKKETDLHMGEIRKLWDVTNKRNRKWIEDNQASLKTQTTAVATISDAVSKLETAQTSDEASLTNLTEQIASERASVLELSSSLDQVGEEMGTVNRAIDKLINSNVEERILTLTLTQENLMAEQGQSDNQINSNQSQINELLTTLKSIDAYRLETNRRLSALTTQLDSLDSRIVAISGTSVE
jgi:chromosome segregation ATPase